MNIFKKQWTSVLLIVLAALLGIAGTAAFFTATRTASDNTFEAGTLDLSVTGNNNIANEPFVLENLGATGDISGEKTWTIKNTGSLPGRLKVRIADLQNQENGCNDQEKSKEPNCDQDNNGELGKVINLVVAHEGTDRVSSLLTTDLVNAIGTKWENDVEDVILQPNEETTITMKWSAGQDSYGNEIQSDSLSFDSVFELIQLINEEAQSQ